MKYSCCCNAGRWTLVHIVGRDTHECMLCDNHTKYGTISNSSQVHTFFRHAQELYAEKIQILCDKKIEGQIVDNINVEVMHVYIDFIDKLKRLDL